MGGSDAATSAAAMISGGEGGSSGMGEGTGGTEGASSKSTKGGTGSQGSADNSFVREVLGSLEGVSEAERPILEKYLSGIDAQVNSRFQSIHDQYSWAKDVDPERGTQALGVVDLIEQNPGAVMEILAESMPEDFWDDDDDDDGDGELDDEENEYGLHPEFMEQFTHLNDIVEAMAEIVLENQRSSKEQQEDQQLEEELEELRGKHGDFDEEAVLSYAAAQDIELEDAIQWYQGFVEKIGGNGAGSQEDSAGPTLSGGGTPPRQEIDPTKMDGKETKNLVAQILAASNLQE